MVTLKGYATYKRIKNDHLVVPIADSYTGKHVGLMKKVRLSVKLKRSENFLKMIEDENNLIFFPPENKNPEMKGPPKKNKQAQHYYNFGNNKENQMKPTVISQPMKITEVKPSKHTSQELTNKISDDLEEYSISLFK